MARHKIDLEKAKKYCGRWVVGKDLKFPETIGTTVTDSSIEFRVDGPPFVMDVKIALPGKDSKVLDFDACRMTMEPEPVYMDMKTAMEMRKRLGDLCNLHPSVVGSVELYDADKSESLLAVYVLSEGPLDEMVKIKGEINTAGLPGAKVLTYECNIKGSWTSIDWKPGLRYKHMF